MQGALGSHEVSLALWLWAPQPCRLLRQRRPRIAAVNHRTLVPPAWSPAGDHRVRRAKPAPWPRNSLLWKHLRINTPNEAENTLTPNPRGLLISLRI